MAEYIDREALIQELDAKLCALHSELDENRIVYDAFTDGFEECVGEVGKFQFAADVARWCGAKTASIGLNWATVDIRATTGFYHRHIHTTFAVTENGGQAMANKDAISAQRP